MSAGSIGAAAAPAVETRNRVADAVLLATASFVFSLLLILQLFGPLKGLTGDEPHYLVVAHSIISDFDLDLRDDYSVDRAWTKFYDGRELPPHYASGRDGGHYSTRSFGLAVYLAPFYAFGLLTGDPVFWCRFGMSILAALAVALTYLLCRDLGATRTPSLFAAGLAAFTIPAVFYAYSIYPEIAAGLLCMVALRLMLNWSGNGILPLLLAGLCLAPLPWLGLKYSVLAIVFGIGFAVRVIRSHSDTVRNLGFLAIAPAVSAALFLGFLWMTYGTFSPSAIYTGVGEGAHADAGINWQSVSAEEGPVAGTLRMALLYFIDQRDGILFYSPFWLFGIAGLILLLMQRQRGAWLMTLAFVAYWFVYALSAWTSGHAPPGRPLTAVIWVLALGLAWAFERIRGFLPLVFTVAAVSVSLCFTILFVFQNHLAYHVILAHTEAQGNNLLASLITPVDLTQLFPNLVNPRDIHPLPALLFLTATLAAVLLLVRAGSGAVKPRQRILPSAWGPLALAALAPVLLFIIIAFSAESFAPEAMQGNGAVRLVFRDSATFGYEPLAREGAELPSFWQKGGTTARVNVVCGVRPRLLVLEVMSLEPQAVTISVEGHPWKINLPNQRWQKIEIPGEYAVRWTGRALFRLEIATPKGRKPASADGGDPRYLGCRIAINAINSPS